MPYLGRDWRSPGDEWVKTKQGWEKLKLWRVKVFENLNSHFLARLMRLALGEWDKDRQDMLKVHQPYIHYLRATSRERKVLTSISEAFIHLDMSTAGQDPRRFNYVCKLIRLLLRDKLPSMSGAAQKYLFNIMEEMVTEVTKSQTNIAAMKILVNFAIRCLHEHHWTHIGSSHLWNGHTQATNRMATKLRKFCIKERVDDGKTSFNDLPYDCVRLILARVPDHKDIVHIGQTNRNNNEVTNEPSLWKHLCFFHFTNRQLLTFVPQDQESNEIEWKFVYQKCVLRYGMRDVFADTLAICCRCDNIFWQSIGHPCISELKAKSRILSPENFIQLFQY